MSATVFEIQFLGGPQDGLRASALALPASRLLFPIGSDTASGLITAYSHVLEGAAAVYQFAYIETGFPHRQLLEPYYRFAGFTGMGSAKGQQARTGASAKRLVKQMMVRFRRWLLEPITYPLQVCA